MQASHLDQAFAVIKPDQGVDIVDAGPELYDSLDKTYDNFRGHSLVACHVFSSDWPTWERHPAGDEIVILLSGTTTLVLRTPGGDESVTLFRQGDYIVVPKNTWHTAKITEPTTMMFVTPGEGTENVESLPDAPHNP